MVVIVVTTITPIINFNKRNSFRRQANLMGSPLCRAETGRNIYFFDFESKNSAKKNNF